MTVRLDNSSSFGRVFFAHKDDRPADAGKCVLHRVDGFQVRVDACRFEQSLHHERFGFLLGVENLNELFVRIGLGIGSALLVGALSQMPEIDDD